MQEHTNEREELPERLPRELEAELKALYRPEIEVPPEVDRRILALAARRVRTARRPLIRLRRVWIAAAAALVIALLGLWFAARGGRDPGAERSQELARRLPEDVDGDGRVDILDAFQLARLLKAGEALDGRWDFNGDGRVDGADVDRVARRAVAL